MTVTAVGPGDVGGDGDRDRHRRLEHGGDPDVRGRGVSTPFTDSPHPCPGVTPVKAVHFTELRTRIDLLRRARRALPPYRWTDPVLTAGVIRVRLRARLLVSCGEALGGGVCGGGGVPAPVWSDAAPVVVGTTSIRAAHLMELRAAVRGRRSKAAPVPLGRRAGRQNAGGPLRQGGVRNRPIDVQRAGRFGADRYAPSSRPCPAGVSGDPLAPSGRGATPAAGGGGGSGAADAFTLARRTARRRRPGDC